jgi:hypothetical protein
MAHHALIDKRPFLLASMAAAIAFYALRLSTMPEIWLIPVKGAAVGLLALYALLRGSGRDGKLLAAMMAVAALADMAMEIDRGAAALLFFTYHVIAIALYLGHTREQPTGSQRAAAVAMLLLTPLVAYLLPADRAEAWPTAIYGLALGGMAACAWMSSFPRYRVGVGAVLFLASDLLIFADSGPLMGEALPQLLIWPLYYLGQLLIAVGIVQTLRHRHPATYSKQREI